MPPLHASILCTHSHRLYPTLRDAHLREQLRLRAPKEERGEVDYEEARGSVVRYLRSHCALQMYMVHSTLSLSVRTERRVQPRRGFLNLHNPSARKLKVESAKNVHKSGEADFLGLGAQRCRA